MEQIKRVKKMLWETKSRVRVERELGESFWTARSKAGIFVESPVV